jgi:hypothetical protein
MIYGGHLIGIIGLDMWKYDKARHSRQSLSASFAF